MVGVDGMRDRCGRMIVTALSSWCTSYLRQQIATANCELARSESDLAAWTSFIRYAFQVFLKSD